MNKPILVARAEFTNALANLINNSGLPSYIIEPVVKDALNDIRRAITIQYENDLKTYQKQIENK